MKLTELTNEQKLDFLNMIIPVYEKAVNEGNKTLSIFVPCKNPLYVNKAISVDVHIFNYLSQLGYVITDIPPTFRIEHVIEIVFPEFYKKEFENHIERIEFMQELKDNITIEE